MSPLALRAQERATRRFLALLRSGGHVGSREYRLWAQAADLSARVR